MLSFCIVPDPRQGINRAHPPQGMSRVLMERLLCVMDELGVTDHTDACLSAIALACMAMVRTSPDDQAEQMAVIARMMARRG